MSPIRRLSFIRSLIQRGRPEFSTMALLALLAMVAWGFAELAESVAYGPAARLERAIILLMRTPGDPSNPIGPPFVEELMRDFTALGGVGVLTLLTIAVAGLLWLQRNRMSMVVLLIAVSSGILFSQVAKNAFDRARPDIVPHGSIVHTASFPSGHSMMSAIVYLTLAVLVARVQERRAIKIYVIALAALLTIAVGVSRVYLGVHWPSDVLAGWAAGTGWALAVALATELLDRGEPPSMVLTDRDSPNHPEFKAKGGDA
ncbi:phosphatase PAP2 family protein [Tropicimonas sp. IMCC34011]|uniref:phosphatase PAP2 family protein n=1 Tax=Tropicimonas sp. IMCC34011 TaxID=2248759 RepID=UPI001E45F27A|nr:phosphatase PAP2 family protein [Tropicimonas sp. IMCC34011]